MSTPTIPKAVPTTAARSGLHLTPFTVATEWVNISLDIDDDSSRFVGNPKSHELWNLHHFDDFLVTEARNAQRDVGAPDGAEYAKELRQILNLHETAAGGYRQVQLTMERNAWDRFLEYLKPLDCSPAAFIRMTLYTVMEATKMRFGRRERATRKTQLCHGTP